MTDLVADVLHVLVRQTVRLGMAVERLRAGGGDDAEILAEVEYRLGEAKALIEDLLRHAP